MRATALWSRFQEPPVSVSALEIKALVRYRDDYCCTECGITAEQHVEQYGRNLDVHRLVPGSKYTVAGCVTLCKPCHKNKPKSPRGSIDRGYRTIAIHGDLVALLEKYAAENGMRVSQVVVHAIRLYLEKAGYWPPAAPGE